MDKTTLISVRVDANDLARIDKYCDSYSWISRSTVLRAAVKIIAEAIKRGLIRDMIAYHPRWDEIEEFTFKKKRKSS